MSSGFVSAGTNEEPVERDDEWRKAQETVEANFRRKQEEGKQDGAKSLYDVLQQNKAAKQEAFEESIRLKNQFRTLDDDEVEFLDSVLESTRAKEAAVKKETAEQLEAFRQQREAAEKALLDEADTQQRSNPGAASPTDQETWVTTAKKRRRPKEKGILVGTKLRKMSSSTEPDSTAKPVTETGAKKQTGLPEMQKDPPKPSDCKSKTLPPEQASSAERKSLRKSTSQKPAPLATSALGLGGYSSDED